MEYDNEKYWFCGKLISGSELSLSINDPVWKFGATVFTTLRVYGSSLDHPLTAWELHCDRISQSLQTFGWPAPDWRQIRSGCQQLKGHYPILRITILPDGRELITGRALPLGLETEQRQGVFAWVADKDLSHRSLAAHKTGNYLNNWLARQQAQKQGAREAILTNAEGHWLETSTGNLWGWAEGHWWTPPLSAGILPGISRALIIQRLKRCNQTVVEANWTADIGAQFEILAYSNCVVELLPIHTVLVGNTTLEYNITHDQLRRLHDGFALDLQSNLHNPEMR